MIAERSRQKTSRSFSFLGELYFQVLCQMLGRNGSFRQIKRAFLHASAFIIRHYLFCMLLTYFIFLAVCLFLRGAKIVMSCINYETAVACHARCFSKRCNEVRLYYLLVFNLLRFADKSLCKSCVAVVVRLRQAIYVLFRKEFLHTY